ncbi:MAG: hypothetical protein Fur0015_05930 [Ignavibacteriales bacterium]
MRRILVLLILLTSLTFPQTLFFEENFDFSSGTLTIITTNWIESPTGSTDIQVTNGSLTYSNYPSSNIGNMIVVDGGATGRSGIYRTFTQQSTSGTTVYWSFLLNVTSTIDMDLNTSSGDYFANFQNSAISAIKSYIYVRQGSSSTKFNIGLAKSSSTSLTWFSNELDINTTYLIVVAYTFVPGTGNDVSKLWINPSLTGSEPSPDISISTGTDANDIGLIQFRQQQKSGDMQIDGIRVSDSWSLAPLPVQLTSFNAGLYDGNVKLNWSTATEVNNYGFEVERASHNSTSLNVTGWKNIGFVQGNGNSNSPKDYTFVDVNPPTGKVLYRLKQIDYDGKFEYTIITEVNIDIPQQFVLEQNFPNPFNPETIIKYSIPNITLSLSMSAVNVTLKVYDILGNEVSTLVNIKQQPGNYEVKFDGSQLPSGVYFYKLQSGNFVQTKKFILMK